MALTDIDDLSGRVAMVTGSATGLGREIALRLASRRADVIINYSRSTIEAEETADLCRAEGAQVEVVKANVSEASECAHLAEAAKRRGRLDILVNNAGITRHARDHANLDALSKDDFMDVYAVNVVGAFLTMQAVKPWLLAAQEQSGRASTVLNTSSIAGTHGIGSSVAYAASKGALNTMTITLARALAPEIRVNAICPGFIGTRWFKDAMDEDAFETIVASVKETTPLAAASGPEDVADSAMFFLTDASRHVTGELMMIDAGLHLGKSPLKR